MVQLRHKSAAREETCFDAVVVGAGFAGMYMLHRLREEGLKAIVVEAAGGVGGTWYWNRYPGARCDVPSIEYSYSFDNAIQQEWTWSEEYASQPEILAYANWVAERLDLFRSIRFNTRVLTAEYDEESARWHVATDDGGHLRSRYFVMATGPLSIPRAPDIDGLSSFEGESHHTARWPHEGVQVRGRRVGVIGTGSSGIQCIPELAREAARVTVFQRTPNYSVPAQNTTLPPDFIDEVKANYPDIRKRALENSRGILRILPGDLRTEVRPGRSALEVSDDERRSAYERAWAEGGPGFMGTFTDLLTDERANATAADFVREKIREKVDDPDTAEKLLPFDHPIGTKRICVDTGYYETFNRDNVELVDLRENPITRAVEEGLVLEDGTVHELDILVFATGFDAMTGALLNIDIRGRQGVQLADHWAEGPRTYLGLAIARFPNLFIIGAVGSPSVKSNMITSLEFHVDWIIDCLAYMDVHGLDSIEADSDAEEAWTDHVNALAEETLYPLANSWYVGANIPGKPRSFTPYIGGVPQYRQRCVESAEAGYRGFTLARTVAATQVR